MTLVAAPVLQVEKLATIFETPVGSVRAVNDVSFSLNKGQILGLVGESGSGKSVTAYSIMGLVEPPGRIVGGRVLFHGENILELDSERRRRLRGNRIAMIFQDPMMTLNPVLRIETQMLEAVTAHAKVTRSEARRNAIEMLGKVGIADAEQRLRAYPHQFSGGMRQRVAIAIALLNKPDLVIADEPTTALDVTVQAQILYEMQQLCNDIGTALVWVSHDLSVVAGFADVVCVMYAGRIVEQGTVDCVLRAPAHPYTEGLIASLPSRNLRGQPLRQVPGTVPSLLSLPEGCAFRPRCPRASAACARWPQPRKRRGQSFLCWHPIGENGIEGRHE